MYPDKSLCIERLHQILLKLLTFRSHSLNIGLYMVLTASRRQPFVFLSRSSKEDRLCLLFWNVITGSYAFRLCSLTVGVFVFTNMDVSQIIKPVRFCSMRCSISVRKHWRKTFALNRSPEIESLPFVFLAEEKVKVLFAYRGLLLSAVFCFDRVDMDMYAYSGVFLVKRFLDKSVLEVTNMSDINKANPHGCDNGALTDRFGVLIQGLLAIVAFSTLMCEYLIRQIISENSFSTTVFLCVYTLRIHETQSALTCF